MGDPAASGVVMGARNEPPDESEDEAPDEKIGTANPVHNSERIEHFRAVNVRQCTVLMAAELNKALIVRKTEAVIPYYKDLGVLNDEALLELFRYAAAAGVEILTWARRPETSDYYVTFSPAHREQPTEGNLRLLFPAGRVH